MSRRFLKATDGADFERTVGGLVGAIGKYYDRQGELRAEDPPETRRKKLEGILGDLYEMFERRFFFCLEVGDDFNIGVFRALKKDYPMLAFLVSSCADEVGEANRYRKLSGIIATAKGDTTLFEEIAKNA